VTAMDGGPPGGHADNTWNSCVPRRTLGLKDKKHNQVRKIITKRRFFSSGDPPANEDER